MALPDRTVDPGGDDIVPNDFLFECEFSKSVFTVLANTIDGRRGYIRVYDSEGDLEFTLPCGEYDEMFARSLVYQVLMVQKRSYEMGVRIGLDRKAREIRGVLGISGDSEL